MPRVGIEPTLPRRAAALQAAWRPTARPEASPAPAGSSTGGSRTHRPRGLSSSAFPVCVPCHQSQITNHPFAITNHKSSTRESRGGVEPLDGRFAARWIAVTLTLPRHQAVPTGVDPVLLPRQGSVQSRYTMGPINNTSSEPPVGVEPTLPSYQDGRLPLQHGGDCRAPGGGRTRAAALARQHATIDTTGASVEAVSYQLSAISYQPDRASGGS